MELLLNENINLNNTFTERMTDVLIFFIYAAHIIKVKAFLIAIGDGIVAEAL